MGVRFAQHAIYDAPDTIRVAKHFIVPEADQSVSFRFDQPRPLRVDCFRMLPTIHFNYEPSFVAGKIRNEMTERHLPSEMRLGKTLAKHAPEHQLRIRHVSAKLASATYRALRWMMLHAPRSTMNITPPQPLPIKGRG